MTPDPIAPRPHCAALGRILEALRTEQLDGTLTTPDEALARARVIVEGGGSADLG